MRELFDRTRFGRVVVSHLPRENLREEIGNEVDGFERFLASLVDVQRVRATVQGGTSRPGRAAEKSGHYALAQRDDDDDFVLFFPGLKAREREREECGMESLFGCFPTVKILWIPLGRPKNERKNSLVYVLFSSTAAAAAALKVVQVYAFSVILFYSILRYFAPIIKVMNTFTVNLR